MQVINTKLSIPPSRAKLVERSRLIHELNQGFECGFVLVSAPAGYGKTTLLSAWYAEQQDLENAIAHSLAAPEYERATGLIELALKNKEGANMNGKPFLLLWTVLLVVLSIFISNGNRYQIATAAPVAWEKWMQECPDCPTRFSNMSDRSLQLDSLGHPHIAYGDRHLYYAWFDGVSWNKTIVDPADGVGSLASLALDGNGYAHISYVHGSSALKYAFQDNTGWHTQVVDDHADHFAFNSIALGPSGDARIAYYHYDDPTPTWDGELLYAHLEVSGWITQTVDSPDNVGYTLSMAVDESGYAHISYLDNTHGDLKYAYQDLSGWHIQTVESMDDVGAFSSIVIDGDGYPHISYQQWNPFNLKYAYKDSGGWHTQIIAPITQTNNLSNTSIALDGADFPYISFNSGDQLMYTYKDAQGWHTSSADVGPGVGMYSSMALDNSGSPHISYYDYSNWPGPSEGPYGKLLYTRQVSGNWSKTLVDEEGDVGNYLSIKTDRLGNPRISYYDSKSDDLKFVYRDGLGWHSETVDSAGNVGIYSSLAVDAAGYTHISYHDASNGDLKYAYQDTGGWHIQTIDSSGTIGMATSIALEENGYAHISYTDSTNTYLKHAYQNDTGWHLEVVDNHVTSGYNYSSISIDSQGFAHITYLGWSGLYYAYQDMSGWHNEEILFENQFHLDAEYPDLALDSSGNPHISFYESYGKDLGYAYKDGLGWHVTFLDQAGDIGLYSSLDLDPDGFTYISYYDNTNQLLKLAYLDQGGWNFQIIIDEPDIHFRAHSISMDPSGSPHLGYYAYHNLNYMALIEPGTRLHLPLIQRQNQ